MLEPSCTLGAPAALVSLAQTQATSAQPAPDSPEARDTEFKPDQGGRETTSGELLLIEAYAAIWLIVFALVYMSIRKQKRLDDRIDRLSEELERVRDQGGG